MKKLLLLFLLFSVLTNAQIVDIPDPNFKAALLEMNGLDINTDGEIQVSEAESWGAIIADNRNISDLTGIEAFINLNRLYISFNNLTTIDLSNNTNLFHLLVDFNNLESLDVSNNERLVWLWFAGNNVSEIDLSNNPNIQILWASNNQLETIDVSQIPSLASISLGNNLLSSVDVRNNFNLSHFDLTAGNMVTELDLSNNPLLCSVVVGSNDSLKYINLRNGGNTLLVEGNTCEWGSGTSNSILLANTNPVLEIICVDDVIFAQNNFINIPPQTVFVDDCLLSNPNFEINTVSLYPNPSNDFINITSKKTITAIRVYSVLGSLVYASISSKHNEMVDISAFDNGIYFIQIEAANYSDTFQIIKN